MRKKTQKRFEKDLEEHNECKEIQVPFEKVEKGTDYTFKQKK